LFKKLFDLLNFQEGILDVIAALFCQQSAHLALPKQKVTKNAINAHLMQKNAENAEKCKKCRKMQTIQKNSNWPAS
jgi:hypothetical protein